MLLAETLGDLHKLNCIKRDVGERRQEKGIKMPTLSHNIDCDANPFTPTGWSVAEHKQSGQLEWDPLKVQLYYSESQQKTLPIEGMQLREELVTKTVLNANILDYLLKNPQQIPEAWKGKAIFFWGTIYRRSDSLLEVRCLCWNGTRWDWGHYPLNRHWDFSNPAALLAT
ncbi:MAG: hypothetical protein ACR2IE_16990 [Candidatus Sumerlaeaceae bacterium]